MYAIASKCYETSKFRENLNKIVMLVEDKDEADLIVDQLNLIFSIAANLFDVTDSEWYLQPEIIVLTSIDKTLDLSKDFWKLRLTQYLRFNVDFEYYNAGKVPVMDKKTFDKLVG